MAYQTLNAAFFGSFPFCYSAAGGVVNFLHAYCEPSFDGLTTFNSHRDPASVELKKFNSRFEMVEEVSAWHGVDVLVVAGFSYRLPIELIRRFKWVINMHPGDLFTNRGATPLATDILRKNTFFTSSLHVIDSERLDSGPFISSLRCPVRYDQSYIANQTQLDKLGGLLLLEALCRLSSGAGLGAVQWAPAPGSYQSQVPAETITRMVAAKSLNDFLAENQSLLLQPV